MLIRELKKKTKLRNALRKQFLENIIILLFGVSESLVIPRDREIQRKIFGAS